MKKPKVSNIESVKQHRIDLINGGITEEKLMAFDAMFNSYSRKIEEEHKQDFDDHQTDDFFRIFRAAK